MALEHTARGAVRQVRAPPPSAKKAHATDPRGELRGEVLLPAWGAGGAPLRGVGQNEAWEAWSSAAHGIEWRWNTHPAWRLPTPSCEFKTRYPLRKTPARQTLAENYAAKCLRRRGGGAPLRGVGLAVWPSRWVTGGPDLPRRLGNRRTWRRAAPNCEFSVRHPLRKTPLGQNQAGSHALNCPPPAWRGAPSRGVEQMSELSHSRFRQCFCSKLRLMAPASVPLSSLETWRGAQVRRGEGESQKRCQNRPKNTRFYGRFCPTFRPFYA